MWILLALWKTTLKDQYKIIFVKRPWILAFCTITRHWKSGNTDALIHRHQRWLLLALSMPQPVLERERGNQPGRSTNNYIMILIAMILALEFCSFEVICHLQSLSDRTDWTSDRMFSYIGFWRLTISSFSDLCLILRMLGFISLVVHVLVCIVITCG